MRAELLRAVADGTGGTPLVELAHEGLVARKVGSVGPSPRKRAVQTFQARAGVEQAHQPRPSAREVARQEQRIVFSDYAVRSVRAVKPVHTHANHRVVDGPEFLDCVVGLRQEAWHEVRGAPKLLQGTLELGG